jgi:hypothetical protein
MESSEECVFGMARSLTPIAITKQCGLNILVAANRLRP